MVGVVTPNPLDPLVHAGMDALLLKDVEQRQIKVQHFSRMTLLQHQHMAGAICLSSTK
jgi:hypothetical protein